MLAAGMRKSFGCVSGVPILLAASLFCSILVIPELGCLSLLRVVHVQSVCRQTDRQTARQQAKIGVFRTSLPIDSFSAVVIFLGEDLYRSRSRSIMDLSDHVLGNPFMQKVYQDVIHIFPPTRQRIISCMPLHDILLVHRV